MGDHAAADFCASLGVSSSLGPVGPLLQQLRSLSTARPESGIQGFTKHLEGLCDSLLEHSEVEQPSSWMSEIRELCYDTKNYLDDAPFILMQDDAAQAELTPEDEDDELTPEEKQELAQLKFNALEARMTRASQRRDRYEIDPHKINKQEAKWLRLWHPRRLPVLHAELIDPRIGTLASMLLGTEEEKAVVSVVGVEGVGKTTLVKRLYHQTGAGGRFQCRAFVRVSANPDMRMLLTSLFTQIQLPGSSKPACCLDAQHLIKNIKQYLQGKRYMIIIDDLWSISIWDIIRRAFPDDCPGSRIMTTTQFEDVASACCSYKSKNILKMEPLEDDQSERLFFGITFGSQDKDGCPETFRRVSAEISEKCGGLPLVTVNIASLLPIPSEIKLQQLNDIRDSLPPILRGNTSSEWINEVLNLMYNYLSPELKTCLLHFAVYPEGYTVYKNDVVKQWVVEGFTRDGQNKEEIARQYFDELVSRGMIQAVDTNSGEVLSCTLHHMVHDLIVKKSSEGNFIIGVDYFQSTVWLPHKVRRLSVQFGGARSARLPAGITLSEVRSLAYFGFYGCADFIWKCKLLRVLTLHVWADDCAHQSEEEERAGTPSGEKKVLTYDLSGISKLLPLRYLKVACNVDVKLPDKIEGLQYLETLEVDGARVVGIPTDIGRLSRLSSLKIAVRELSRQDICILQALPELSALSLDVWTTPVEMIVFHKGVFSVLNYFKFRCSVPCLKFEAGSMPDLQYLNLCFNAREADQHGIVPIGIGHLPGLKEITAEIWGADTDVGSTFRTIISNHPNNPRIDVQWLDSRIFYGDTVTSMSKDDDIDKGEEEKKDAESSSGAVSADTRAFTNSSQGTASTSSFYAPSSSDCTASSSATGDERQDLVWLLENFRSATIDLVDFAYREAGGDPFLAARILHSRQDQQPPQQPPSLPDLSLRAGSAVRKAARRPRKLPLVAFGMVTDVIGKGYLRSATPRVSLTSGWKYKDGESVRNLWNDERNVERDSGKHYQELSRKEDEKASREIFEARNKHITNTVTIDLHGQHVKQAMKLLKVHMLVSICMPSTLLRVITGCGAEGTGKGNIKQSVMELVEKEGIEWHEGNSGTIVMRLGGPREYRFLEHDSDSD